MIRDGMGRVLCALGGCGQPGWVPSTPSLQPAHGQAAPGLKCSIAELALFFFPLFV